MRPICLVVLVACYAPNAPTQVPCGASGACPAGQLCDPTTDRCVTQLGDAGADSLLPDAPVDALIDAPVAVVGCADGEREAFTSIASFPAIAGCAATWSGTPSLRAMATGVACGDDRGDCAVPADACAAGWHMCGESGAINELSAIQPAQCAAAAPSGQFVAALSHCSDNVDQCTYDTPLPCFTDGWCSEPVCCGADCTMENGCKSGVWPMATTITTNNADGCGMHAAGAGVVGVLCCVDN